MRNVGTSIPLRTLPVGTNFEGLLVSTKKPRKRATANPHPRRSGSTRISRKKSRVGTQSPNLHHYRSRVAPRHNHQAMASVELQNQDLQVVTRHPSTKKQTKRISNKNITRHRNQWKARTSTSHLPIRTQWTLHLRFLAIVQPPDTASNQAIHHFHHVRGRLLLRRLRLWEAGQCKWRAESILIVMQMLSSLRSHPGRFMPKIALVVEVLAVDKG